ncbi:uncharacterized protein Z518_02664 [Rhinocladiella mackenziei CBS 650.93]|uniref:Flavoprotein oxygenase n=1 Tax=Rhinocladiella mackenziei CBS 650.93 TaxID=1442369 RepID=A0A0D2IQ65_9EURO|nr:uncharacterized protein Z518_02664 [Rhinocladiella mackenziei CBS 650.93]KIX08009.1 hypothetical protein Z518_02664 [Rhinocladiella mackenziei CBS 650.93]
MPSPSSPPPQSVEARDFTYQQSSPLSLRQQSVSPPPAPPPTDPSQPHDYNFSGAVYDESTSSAESEDVLVAEPALENDFLDVDRRISGCSSISSFPVSVSPNLPPEQGRYGSPRTPSKRGSGETSTFEPFGGTDYAMTSPRSAREYHSVFRHPSSVRALQMRDEVFSDTHSVWRHHRRSGSQMSSYSHRSSCSTQTSPAKRSGRPRRGSGQKASSNLKKEFPLVLLHCTLLPPTLLLQSTPHEDSLLSEFLPEEYRDRWIALRDKLVGDTEVRTRGILIPHPREDYELLEERLLESLELQVPRIRHNHFFRNDGKGGDSGFESGSHTEDEGEMDLPNDIKCPDCGRRLRADEVNRKWEIKVFAANGLMRAGAWGAAWQEMEKVDVEVRVWLPEDLRRGLEARLPLLETSRLETGPVDSPNDFQAAKVPSAHERDEYGDAGRLASQVELDGLYEGPGATTEPVTAIPHPMPVGHDVPTVMVAYAKHFFRDNKNFLAGVLSSLVLFFALTGREAPGKGDIAAPNSVSTQLTEILTTTVTATRIAISTATVTTSISRVTETSLASSASEEAGSSTKNVNEEFNELSLHTAPTEALVSSIEISEGTSLPEPDGTTGPILEEANPGSVYASDDE